MILSLKKSATLVGAEEFWRRVIKVSREKYNFNFSQSEQVHEMDKFNEPLTKVPEVLFDDTKCP
jgi:hypothetical protein